MQILKQVVRLAAVAGTGLAAAAADKAQGRPAPLDQYVVEAQQRAQAEERLSPGSLWRPGAVLADLGRDLKASQVDDLVTILVTERASAVARGSTKTARKSSAQSSVGALFGPMGPAGALANLASASGSSELDGQGATSRDTVLTTTLSARVANVLPNGYLLVEGFKTVMVNSEVQVVTVRGVVRPFDVGPGNLVRSDRLAQLEVRINGKGVVGDAVRRPFFLYRLLLGLLPF
jgi:flagellar L-ring protein precursor FlgH